MDSSHSLHDARESRNQQLSILSSQVESRSEGNRLNHQRPVKPLTCGPDLCPRALREGDCLKEGDAIQFYSRSAEAWLDGEVAKVLNGVLLRVDYQIGQYWISKTFPWDSEDILIPSAIELGLEESDPMFCGSKGKGKGKNPEPTCIYFNTRDQYFLEPGTYYDSRISIKLHRGNIENYLATNRFQPEVENKMRNRLRDAEAEAEAEKHSDTKELKRLMNVLMEELKEVKKYPNLSPSSWKLSAKQSGTELFHQTDAATAKIILSTQEMKPGSKGLAGGGIYFATTEELTGHKAHAHGVILRAYVRLGKILTLEGKGDRQMTGKKLKSQGFDSVCIARKVSSGQEYVVYDSAQVLYIERA